VARKQLCQRRLFAHRVGRKGRGDVLITASAGFVGSNLVHCSIDTIEAIPQIRAKSRPAIVSRAAETRVDWPITRPLEPNFPCPQGILQGVFCGSPRDRAIQVSFMQPPQWLEANSLRVRRREFGENRREFFSNGREFSKSRSESEQRAAPFGGIATTWGRL
jgi:hypothetical protein